ncbi:DedA family protein [Candidatus Gracilibacteria bacterium]|nr:DedA family protein [Candidatus Gracilibacteria bacterium]MBF0913508.1 DedA family protein [Candidatus Gracilibacteria bacterium]
MIVLAFISIFKKEWFELFIEWLKIVISDLGYWNYLIIFGSSFIEAFPVLGVVVPGQNILMIVGGFFGNISQTNLIYVGILASIGAILGNYVGYLLGKIYGDSFFEKYGNWFGVGLTEVKYLKKSIDKWGAWGVILGKFHNVARAFIPFIAGSMGMKSKSFMIYNIIGSIIWAVSMVVLGMIFVEYYKIILDYVGYGLLILLLAFGIYIYKYKKEEFKRYMVEKNEEMEKLYGKK